MGDSTPYASLFSATVIPQPIRRVDYAGWYIAGIIYLLRAGVFAMLVIQSLRPGPAASSLTAFFGGIGFFVSGSLAVGLFLDSPKCRWLVFIFAAIAAGYYMALGIFASQRDHVALWAGLSLGVATIAGWILLLDRKPNWAKIIVGAMLLLSCEVFGLTALKTLFASTFS